MKDLHTPHFNADLNFELDQPITITKRQLFRFSAGAAALGSGVDYRIVTEVVDQHSPTEEQAITFLHDLSHFILTGELACPD